MVAGPCINLRQFGWAILDGGKNRAILCKVMKAYTAVAANGEAIEYVDKKRFLWVLSVLYPLQPLLGIWLHWKTGHEPWLMLGIPANYLVAPILDWIVGEDMNNPPPEIIGQLERDKYYRLLTYAVVPMHFITLLVCVWYACTAGLGPVGFFGLAVVAGLTGGLAINTGHELGHKNSAFEKRLARWVLAVPAYGHFSIEHNQGHHKAVSTPDDPASARMGESIYRFACREIPGAFARAWQIEKGRLASRGKSAWHPDNRLLADWGLSLLIAIACVVAFGWLAAPFLVVHHLFAYWQLTSANYVEHYGLLRAKDANGRYERCEPRHSWNSNHIFSNLVLFHLERHSDHHANPLRRYQSLRHFDDVPRLPNGYFGVYLLAYVPWLWFRVMDRRLLNLPHVQGDLTRVNICPAARPRLLRRYGNPDTREASFGSH